jgi:hypothetical protein
MTTCDIADDERQESPVRTAARHLALFTLKLDLKTRYTVASAVSSGEHSCSHIENKASTSRRTAHYHVGSGLKSAAGDHLDPQVTQECSCVSAAG